MTKTEGISLLPEDVTNSIIGEITHIEINPDNDEATEKHGATGFRTDEELMQVLNKISAILAYKKVCEHGKLQGIIGNNRINAQVPFDDKTFSVFQSFLCHEC